MRTKTRCILSVILIVLPIIPIVCSSIGKHVLYADPNAGWALMGIAVPLGEMSMLLYFTAYPILCAVAAVGMYCFSREDIPKKLDKLLLAFPIAMGVCGLLFVVLMLLGLGNGIIPVLVAMVASQLGWLACNIAALVHLRREKRKNSA